MPRCLVLLFGLWVTACFAFDSVDPGFAPVIRGPGGVRAMAWHSSGLLYTSVNGDKLNGEELSSSFVRFDEDGVWDRDYQPEIDGDVYTVDSLDTGQLIISGTFTEVAGHESYHIARLNADGTVDTSFTVTEADLPESTSHSGSSSLSAIEEGPGGSLFAGFNDNVGYDYDEFWEPFYVWPDILVKLNSDGSRDVGFAPEFRLDDSENVYNPMGGYLSVTELLWSSDGHLLVGGEFDEINGTAQAILAKLDLNGDLVETYRPLIGESTSEPYVYLTNRLAIEDIVEASDGSIYIGGNFTEIDGTEQFAVARLDEDGELDLAFRVEFVSDYGSSPSVSQILPLASGDLLLIADTGRGLGSVLKVDAYGRKDSDFSLPFRNPYGLVAGPEGLLYAYRTGISLSNGVMQPSFAKFSTEGVKDADFELPDLRDLRTPDSVHTLPGGRLLLQSMWITEVNDVEVPGIAVLDRRGALDTTIQDNISINGVVRTCKTLPGGRMLVGGYFTNVSGMARESVAMLEADGTLVEGFDLGLGSFSSLDDLFVLPSGRVILDGRFYNVTNTFMGEFGIMDFNASSSSSDVSYDVLWDDDFFTGLDDMIILDDVAEQPDGKLVLLGWFYVNDTSVDAIRLMPDGSYDESFTPEALFSSFYPSEVEACADGSLYFAGSSFRLTDESSSRYIVKFLPDGTVDTAFNGPSGYVNDMKLDADGSLWCAGSFTNPRRRITHLDSNGNVIESFDLGDSTNNSVQNIALEAPSNLYIAGSFTSVQGEPRAGLARINLETPIKPQVRIAPINKTVGEGTALTLGLSGVGQDETYAWYHNGERITGETGASLRLGPVSLVDAGSYSVEAVNIAGTTESDATLAVTEYDLAAWMTAYGITQEDADADGDGRSNAEEYLARTNPRQANSFLDTRMARTGEGLRLAWATAPVREYQVEVCNDLVSWEAYGEPITGSGADSVLDLTLEQMDIWRFWRVSVSKP